MFFIRPLQFNLPFTLLTSLQIRLEQLNLQKSEAKFIDDPLNA